LGTDGAGKTDKGSIKKRAREVSRHFSVLSEGRDYAGNSLEKMIYKWGQMSIHDNLSPLVFDI
jgi:hypothetical protein